MGPCARRSNMPQDIPKCKCKLLKNDNAKLQRDLNEARKENNALRSIVNKNESECYKIHKLEKQVEVLSSRVKNVRSPQKRSASLESIPQKRSASLDRTMVSENLDVTQVLYESLSKKKNIAELNEKYKDMKQRETVLLSELSHEKRQRDQAKKHIQTLQYSIRSLKDDLKSANIFFKNKLDQFKHDCCELRKTSIKQLEVFRSALSDIHVQIIEQVQSMAIEGYKPMQLRGKKYKIQHVHGELTGSHSRHGKRDNCNSLTNNLYTNSIQERPKPAECDLGVSSIFESDNLREKYKELEERLRQGRLHLKKNSTVCNAKHVNSSTNTDHSYGFNEQQLIQRVQCFEIKPDIMKLETKIDTPKVIRDTSGNIVNTNFSEIILAKDELILSLEKRVQDLNSRCETLITKLKQSEEKLKYLNLQKESFDETRDHIHKRVQDFIAVQETNARLKTRIHNLESENERLERLISIEQSSMFSNSAKLKQSETLLKESEAQVSRLQENVYMLTVERDKVKKEVSTYELHTERLECEIETLKDKIQTLTCMIDNCKSEKNLCVKENNELHKRLSDIENNATTLLEKENELKRSREEQASLTRECRQHSKYIEQLEEQLHRAAKQILELKNNRENETEIIYRLNDDLQKAKLVEQQLNEKDRDLRQDKSKLLELTKKLENCENKNNTIKRLYTESQNREETLQKELENAKASLIAADSNLKEIARKYEISEQEKSQLIIENQTLYDNLKRTQLDNDVCKEKHEQENGRLANKLLNSETQYRDLEKRFGVLSEEKYDLERKLSSFELLKESVEKRQHEKEILKTEHQVLLLKFESLKNDKCQIEKQIVDLLECPNSAVCTNSVLDNLRKRLVENQDIQTSLTHECDTKKTKLGQLEQQLQLASKNILESQESQKAQIETISRLNDDLQKAKIVEQQLNEKDRDLRQDKRKLLELTRKLENCKNENNNINRLYTESQTREETLQKELENAKASLKAADSNLEEIVRKYEISEHEKSELILENQTLYDNLKHTQLDNDVCKEKNEQENTRLAKQLSNSETQYRDLEKRLGFLSEEKYELERKFSSLELQKEAVEKRQHETEILKTEQQALLKKIESLNNDQCQFEKQIVELLECPNSAVCTYPVLDNLRKRLVENQELQCSFAHECESNKTKLGQLEQQLQLHVNEISALNERNKIQVEKNSRLNKDLKTAKIVEQQLNNKCRDLLQDTNNLREQSKSFDTLAKQLENSENEKANMNQLYKESKKREKELIKTLETTEAMLVKVQEQTNKMSQKYDTCRKQNTQLLKDIQDCHVQLKSAQQNLIAAEKSFNSKLKSELDRNEAEKMKQSEKHANEIYELNKEIERAKKANFDDDHGAQDKLARANKDLAETRRELEETKTRLSKLMGQKLTNNNPNIADLSDQNRPTKLAERYTELYDNQWTDAFEVIDQGNEQATIDLLMQILYDCFTFCEKESMRQLDNLRSVLMLRKGHVVVSEILNKQLKDCRKAVAIESGQHLLQTYMADLQQNGSDLSKVAKKVPSYVKECFSVCWLMSIQDPSLVLGNSDQVGPDAAFNSEQYKAYTESGPVVEFLVWPAMFLYKDGPLLCKGVAQGRRSSRKH